ncbi:hypothetical protein FACS189427_06510 [Planctomycetales bacterium]|nr:hypothetical protein FACS189427_06510 [Planctomycetales bacterium]
MAIFRFSYIGLVFFFCAALRCCAADNPVAEVPQEIPPENRFEAVCADGEIQTGSISAMNAEQLVLSEGGKNQKIPLEHLESLQNCSENPFLSIVLTQQKPDTPNYPAAAPRRNNRQQRNPKNNKIILPPLLTKSETISKPKISYPDSVIVLTLRDGSRIAAEEITIKGQTVQNVPLSRTKNAAAIQFPVQQLASVRFDVKSLDAVYTPPEAKANFEREWKEIIETLYNYPSIVVWVPFNEGWGQYETCRILDLTKKLDPTRLVDGPSGWEDRGCGDMYDKHQYRGPGMFPPEEKRATVLGEYGGLGLPVEGHTWVKSDKNWGYGGNLKDKDDLLNTYIGLNNKLHPLIGQGLSAAVYTQTTDCEVEVNGLMTYDRILKVDADKFKASNDSLHYPAPERRTVLAAAPDSGKEWAYTTDKPADGWEKPEFSDNNWKRGKSGFGTKETPNTFVNTEWNTKDIWVRTTFDMTGDDIKEIEKFIFEMYHDDNTEVYINGVKVIAVDKWVSNYKEFQIPDSAKVFKEGKNLIAIHTHQDAGGQYIDARLFRIVPSNAVQEKVW